MTTTALDALPAPQRVLRGADCGSSKLFETIAGLVSQTGLREPLRASHDDGSPRAAMLSARAQGEAA